MRLSSVFSLAGLTAYAVAEDAYLWTVDHGAAKYANVQASSISSDVASSIIARRRGILTDEHLTNFEGGVLRDIKQYGGYQMPLYGTTSDLSPKKLLIRITGYTGTVSQFTSLPDLWIEDAAKDLSNDFKARKDIKGICEYDLTIPTKSGIDLVYSYNPEDSTCMSITELQRQPTILAILSTTPSANDVSKGLNGLLRTLSHLSVTANIETTLLILPPVSKLHKAQHSRRANTEAPLEKPAKTTGTHTKSSSSVQATATTHPLPKVIPQCFSSKEICDNTTNSCSGHGSCYKAYNSCYKCRCGQTLVRENPDGTKKHVAWGGNACQKKDISTEFILFAGFGIVMAALVAGAVGAMYTMGAEELPSVIGAGVAGPKQK